MRKREILFSNILTSCVRKPINALHLSEAKVTIASLQLYWLYKNRSI